jgi:hypothetical protein
MLALAPAQPDHSNAVVKMLIKRRIFRNKGKGKTAAISTTLFKTSTSAGTQKQQKGPGSAGKIPDKNRPPLSRPPALNSDPYPGGNIMAAKVYTHRPVVLLALLALNGCGIARRAEIADAKKHLVADVADCKAQYAASFVQQADCMTATENVYEKPFINDPEMLDLLQAKRQVLAVQVDNGQLTKAQANLELATLRTQIKQTELDRRNAAAAVSAQQSAASAQMLGASARLLQGTQPVAPPVVMQSVAPRAVNTTCNGFGNTVNCTSY